MNLNVIRPIGVKNSRFCRIRKHRRHSFLINDVKMHCRNRQLTTCVPAIGEKDKIAENPAMLDYWRALFILTIRCFPIIEVEEVLFHNLCLSKYPINMKLKHLTIRQNL